MTSPTPQAPAREAVELPPLPEKAHQMDGKGHSDDRMRAYALKARSDVLDLAERLKQEAQIHAQEARTANATIAEIYQLCTGATGEPGNWNGAEPVRALLAAKQEEVDKMREVLLEGARRVEALKRDCGMDPESPIALQNSRYMGVSYFLRAAVSPINQGAPK